MDGEVHQSLLLTRAGEDHRITVTGWLCDLTLLVALTILMALLYCPNVALSHIRIYSDTVLDKHLIMLNHHVKKPVTCKASFPDHFLKDCEDDSKF